MLDINLLEVNKLCKAFISRHAPWSAYSIENKKVISELLREADSKDFAIYEFDIDSVSQEKQIELFGQPCQGYYESLWIESGKIEYVYLDNNLRTELEKFILYLKQKRTEQNT